MRRSTIFRRVFELCPSLIRIYVNYYHPSIMFKRLVRQLNRDDGTWVLKGLEPVHVDEVRDFRFGVKDIN